MKCIQYMLLWISRDLHPLQMKRQQLSYYVQQCQLLLDTEWLLQEMVMMRPPLLQRTDMSGRLLRRLYV